MLLKLGPISYLADAATKTTFSSADLIGLRTSLMVHAGGGLLVLLAAAALAIYKPPGMTLYGIRKQREQKDTGVGSPFDSTTSTPRWVKVFGVIVVVLVVLAVIMMLTGGHGPGAHMPSDG
ncbi:hypothetical protein LP417_13845 [Polaromonas sp. P1-6]|nr:hypothetical protein LP417_13845 [Polaromonas sp. P1-6]UUZ70229.1 hypothetical protein LP416_14510 [Polaromonas sp. P2-4]